MKYVGGCHCGAVRFELESEPITTACVCNCSICSRRGVPMSSIYYPPGAITIEAAKGALAVYRWGDHMMNHYFCARCGVYPFCDVIATHKYRVNLGCVEGLDLDALAITKLDGRSF
ncbi:MAG TPA: GFA family protein [Kofleriaceae bacterium]|nr:GFA family protein [Kofleriaceae bacterium]